MQDLAFKRCCNHGLREAAARCPECGRFFCRECVTEHEDRVLCASCLRKLLRPSLLKRFRYVWVIRILQFSSGIFVLWLFFYYFGQVLLSLPTSFHEGTVWQSKWWE